MPEFIRNALWIALDNVKAPSCNHRFEIKALQFNGKTYQHIVHTQKNSTYRKEYKFSEQNPVDGMTVYIIGFDNHWLMRGYFLKCVNEKSLFDAIAKNIILDFLKPSRVNAAWRRGFAALDISKNLRVFLVAIAPKKWSKNTVYTVGKTHPLMTLPL